MSFYKELSNDIDFEPIRGVQFFVMSPDNILTRSVCEITRTDTYDGNDPWPHGLFDPRMGVIEHNKVCVTCEQKNTFCPGHFGHIVLAKPVFYIQFFNIVRNILKCVCFRCSKLLIDPNSLEVKNLLQKKFSRQKRWEIIFKLCSKVKRCRCAEDGGCGAKQPNVTKEGMLKISMEWKDFGGEVGDAKKQILNAEDVIRIFRRVNDQDSEILGFHKKFSRPEHLICTVLPVPPPSVRPSVRNDTGQRSEDDLTHKLSMIVKINNNLKQKIEKGTKEQIDIYSMLLQYEVATFIDNTVPGIPPSQQRTGRPIRSLTERLKGKEGRIRGNLMGKRVDFSARSVITPDPNISIDELGVPIKIAMNLTHPEIVNKFNIDKLTEYVLNGPDNYPGAKYIRKTTENRTIRLRNMNRADIKLDFGDVVERHLQDGDYVLFNRQPSLHRSSMMAHKVRVMNFNTFRLNVMVTPSFNADFDGDEMNMHVAQSLQSHEELVQLAAVPTQIISPRECKPIVSIVQDIVLGVYRLTNENVKISKKQLFNILAINPQCNGSFSNPVFKKDKLEYWNGQQVMTSIMPRKINMHMPNGQYDEKKNKNHLVIIKNGEVLQGTFDKDTYQARTYGIIHSIYNEYGPEETKNFFDNTQKLICNWLVLNGFSVGISDLIVDSKTNSTFQTIINDMKLHVHEIINSIHSNTYENKGTKSNSEDFEKKVNDILNEAIKKVGDSGAKRLDENVNRLINMIKSKSKGNTINVSQMIGCLGQQNVDGRRIPYGFDDRTLPHYKKYDDGPEARGFVENSFINGLTPQEFFFSAMGGREGLIDTAVQSVTGDTAIIIIEDGVPVYTPIGDWIDQHLEKDYDSVKHFTDRRMELLDTKNIYISTTDYDGNVTWGEVTAMTRHDPGAELYEVITKSGRRVIVTESKSLLIWQENKKTFLEIPTPEIKVGDCVPVTSRLEFPSYTARSPEVDFEFTKYNGIFIGLYIAHGFTTESLGGQLSIYTHDSHVFEFVKEWFTLNNIQYIDNSSIGIVGYSMDFVKCINKMVGNGTNKSIPIESYTNKEFATGLVTGFFMSHRPNPASEKIVNGISTLCTNLNMFTTINNGHIDLKGDDYTYHNDVVLDPIVCINIIDPLSNPLYSKVYDLTIPSTLNFGLANGLQVRDTSETGYIQRKLVKAMEDCKVGYDLSVRNASGTIIQFLYGEDGMDSSKIESQSLSIVNVENIPMEYKLKKSELRAILEKDVFDKVVANANEWGPRLDEHIKQLEKDREFIITKLFNYKVENNVMYPVSLTRIINIAKGLYSGPVSDIEPEKILNAIDHLCSKLYVNNNNKGNQLFQILLRSYLSPREIIVKHRLCNAAFDYVVKQIEMKFYESLAHPSEMVGVIAAQSIGEPATQLTLNTFHLAGVSAASKTVRGVPRLKELLSVSKNMKTPTMTIHFKDEYKHDHNKCLELMNDIRLVRFKDIVTESKIFFDPNNSHTEDSNFINEYKKYGLDDDEKTTYPWLLRLEFNKDMMLQYAIDMIQIHQKLLEYYRDDTISCMFSDDNAEKLVFRIKLVLSENGTNIDDTLSELKALEHNILEKVIIKGIEGVEKVSIMENKYNRYNPLTKTFDNLTECVVYTEGTNLRDIFSVEYINHAITTSNNIIEIFEVLGIEAARQALYNEIQEVLESITVNYRHTSLLIDVQTNKGYILSIDRHGINRGDIGPLAKCSFEETTDKLIKAGIFAEYDKINGVSGNIILGQMVPAGTGDVHVLIDNDKLPSGPPADEIENDIVIEMPTCEETNFSFNFVMPEIKKQERTKNKLVIKE